MNKNNRENTTMSEKPLHRGRGWGGSPNPLKNREQFFKLVEEGLQQYFDTCDRYWGGILHLTVGVKCGEVGGIIKSENMLSYEGFTLHRIETILKYVLPKYVPRTEVGFAVGSILDELRMERPPLTPLKEGDSESTEAEPKPKPKGRPKKQNTKQSTLNTKQANTENHEQEETEGQPR